MWQDRQGAAAGEEQASTLQRAHASWLDLAHKLTRGGRCSRSGRQADCERRSLAQLARDDDVAAHYAAELARDGEAEAGAAVLARGRRLGLRELLEQFSHLLGSHADAGVRHREFDPAYSIE